MIESGEIDGRPVRFATVPCPFAPACDWHLNVALPPLPSAYLTLMIAAEMLGHLVGRYGADGRSGHPYAEVEALGLNKILAQLIVE